MTLCNSTLLVIHTVFCFTHCKWIPNYFRTDSLAAKEHAWPSTKEWKRRLWLYEDSDTFQVALICLACWHTCKSRISVTGNEPSALWIHSGPMLAMLHIKTLPWGAGCIFKFWHLPVHSDKWGWCSLSPMGVLRWKCQKSNVSQCLNAQQENFAAFAEMCPKARKKERKEKGRNSWMKR